MALVRCTGAFTVAGSEHVYTPGEIYEDDHPIVLSHPNDFEPLQAHMSRQAERVHLADGVEAATAAPGEKRSVAKARKASG